MQKKMKRGIIIAVVSLLVIAVTLALLGLARIELDQSALNYNMITANFSDSSLYGPGLYWIGIANKFLRFNKNQQTLHFSNISTYSSDFYAIRANMQVTIQYNFEGSADQFASASNFLILFAENPLSIIRPLINNQISVTLSAKNSSFYQQESQLNAILEASIKSKVQKALMKWVSASVNVIVESVVCQGSVSNTQTIDRQIQTLLNDYKRTASSRVELTDYFSNIYANKLQQIEAAASALQAKSLELGRIYSRYSSSGQPEKLTQAIYKNRPIEYNMNLVNLLEEIAALGNRTFPY